MRIAGEDIEVSGALLPPLPQAVTSFGAATHEGQLFLVGGYSGTPHAYSRQGQSKAVWALDVANEKGWQQIAKLERGLQGLVAVHHDDELCIFGGSHASNPQGEPTVMRSMKHARCLKLTSEKNGTSDGDRPHVGAWQNLPDLPRGLSSFGGALIDSTVYLAGGWTLSGDPRTGEFLGEVWALDLEQPQHGWRTIEAPFQRRAVGVAAVDGKLAVVGGLTAKGELSREVDVYDPGTGQWSKAANYPTDAFGIAVGRVADRLYASGRDGVLRSWKPGEKEWRDEHRLALTRFFHELLPLQGDLVAVGGIGGMHTRGRTRVVERLSVDGKTSYGQMTFPYPGKAKNRQGILTRGEQIYLFGGNVSLGQHSFAPDHFTNAGWLFDLATLEFRPAVPYPVRRQSMQTLSTEKAGLAVGGFGHESLGRADESGVDSKAVTHPEIFAFDWKEQNWSRQRALPRGRTQFGITQGPKSQLWIFGGLNYDPGREEPFDHVRSIWSSDAPSAKSPVQFEPVSTELPGPRRAFAGATMDGRYYLIGGMKGGFQLVEDCAVFDFEQRTFSEIPCPAPRLSGALVPVNDKLYLVGGSEKTDDGLKESRAIDVFDPKTQEWSTLDFELPLSTKHLRAVPYGDHILLLTTHYENPQMTLGLLQP